MSTIERNAPHLKPVVQKYGKPVQKVGAPGGWELHVTSGGMKGALNSSSQAYAAIMKSSIVPKPKNLAVPSPVKKTVVIPKAPRVMFGVGNFEVASAMVAPMAAAANADQREAIEDDIDAAESIRAAAFQAAVRAATRVKQRTLTKKKRRGRTMIHGYSRRSGVTVKDFKRKSPRR